MKLPQVQFTGTQSLGREDPRAPQRVAGARFRAVENQGRLLETINQTVDRLYRNDAKSEYTDRLLDYEERASQTSREMTDQPYMEGENGEMVSRHTTVYQEYSDTEEALRKEILENTNNNLARSMLEDKLAERSQVHRGQVAAVAAKWTRNENNRRYTQNIERALQQNNHDQARELYTEAATSGALTQDQMIKLPSMIMADEQYSVAVSQMATVQGPQGFIDLRQRIQNDTHFPDLSKTQRDNLVEALDNQLMGRVVHSFRSVVETEGLDAGLQFIHNVNRSPIKKVGWSDEAAKYATVTRLQQIYSDYEFERKQSKTERELNIRAREINAGDWADPKTEGKPMDRAFELWAEENEVEEFTPEWMNRIKWHASTQGWVPPSVMVEMRGMLNYGDPNAAFGAATMVSMLADDPSTSRAVRDNMSEDDIRLAQLLNDYASYGQDPMETVKNVRQGLNQVPDSHLKARGAEFDKEYRDEASNLLEDQLEDDPHASAWYQFFTSNPDATIEVAGEYRRLMRREYLRTGNADFAAKRGYQLIRHKYAIVERGNDLRLSPMSPEAIYNGGQPTPWITEEFNTVVKRLDRDPDEIELIHFNDGGRHAWYLYDSANNDILMDPDNPGKAIVMDFNYQESAEAQRRKEDFRDAQRAARIKVQKERAAARARKEHLDKYGSPPMHGPTSAVNVDPGAVARILDKGGQKFWEFMLGVPGEEQEQGSALMHGPRKENKDAIPVR